ncbi:MAG: hypothetical protein WCL71_03595 [Deltaproteobacteria bacterium]
MIKSLMIAAGLLSVILVFGFSTIADSQTFNVPDPGPGTMMQISFYLFCLAVYCKRRIIRLEAR